MGSVRPIPALKVQKLENNKELQKEKHRGENRREENRREEKGGKHKQEKEEKQKEENREETHREENQEENLDPRIVATNLPMVKARSARWLPPWTPLRC
jgi:hypothetical protein